MAGKVKLGIVGCGYLGNIIADAYCNGYLEEYELVGVVGRSVEPAQAMAAKAGCRYCTGIDQLLDLKPDYIAEAASGQAVRDIAVKTLKRGIHLAVLSIGAFADQEFYETVQKTAREHGAKVYIASGAIGGFDVLRTISLMGSVSAGIETRKGPESLQGTPVFKEELMEREEEVFTGNAKDAIALFPTKVNVAVAASLAAAGAQNTKVKIRSVPGMQGDDHKITADVEGIHAVVDIYSSTSAIAGWSVVALLRNLVSPIVL